MNALHRFSLLLFLFTALSFASCDDDDVDPNEDLNNRLEGDWSVESWTANGRPVMGTVVARFDMEYEKQGPADGEAEWTILFVDGRTTLAEGDYDIENSGSEIDFDGSEFDIEIDGDELTLTGDFDGTQSIITAERD